MNLKQLISALAEEIQTIQPELAEQLNTLSTLDCEDPIFSDTLKLYRAQVERLGEAVELVGSFGLSAACTHIVDNINLLAKQPTSDRELLIYFLAHWPDAMVNYLSHLDDPSHAAALAQSLSQAPIPLDQDKTLTLMYELGYLPGATVNSVEQNISNRPVIATPEDVSLAIPKDVDQGLLEGFFQEAPIRLEELVQLLEKQLSDNLTDDDLESAKRIVHTLKGNGAMLGVNGLTNLGHHFEDILEYLQKNNATPSSQITKALLDGGYCMAQMVGYLMETDDFPSQSVSTLQNILDLANMIDRNIDLSDVQLRHQATILSTSETLPTANPTQSAQQTIGTALRVSYERIEELFRLSAEISVSGSAIESQIKQLSTQHRQLSVQQLRVKKRLIELESNVDIRSLSLLQNKTQNGAVFDPLEMDQFNELHSTTNALVEEFNDNALISEELQSTINQLSALENRHQVLASDLQHLVIGTRMAEVASIQSRLQRNINITAQMTDKEAKLVLTGGSTLIDSEVLNRLAEPLLHLLRNAVDHGIESPEARVAAGKERVGTIHLDFSAQGQQITLRCHDDGRGLDYDGILSRALEKGLVRSNDNLSQKDIAKLIFTSGFSTRDKVTEVSGRGVGMDVVREWLENINGSVQVDSEPGQSTTVTLQFASSMTTVQSLIVAIDQQHFALPSIQIQQALSHDDGHFVEKQGKLQYHHNDMIYAAKYLSDLLGFQRTKDLEKAYAILIRVQDEVWALAIETLHDSRELLLKKPGRYLQHINGIVGTSVLGDGSIAIHLDIAQLLSATGSQTRQQATSRSSDSATVDDAKPSVLVVDDSLSVRTTLQELIEDAGFRVRTVRDGLEAIKALDTQLPHIVLTDLEMPNMNGIELSDHIRNTEMTKTLPIIMITSRSQDKHRELAKNAGINQYLTKPYNGYEVIKAITDTLAVTN